MDMVKSGFISRDEAKSHPDRNIITRALGIEESLSIDGIFNKLLHNDIIVMCSDGLYEMIDDNIILNISGDISLSLEKRAEKMIEYANSFGGKDNVSVILIGYWEGASL